ncbi:MAG: phosphodiester glycosidase family protein [Vicinamibacterales bacterium]
MTQWRGVRTWLSLLAGLLALAPWGAAGPTAQATPPTRPFAGVTLTERRIVAPRPARLIVAQVDLKTPGVRVAVSPPAGSRETVRETTLAYLSRTGAQLAVNAHFFLPFPSDEPDAWVIGLAAAEGRVYRASSIRNRTSRSCRTRRPLNIDAANRARIVHRRPGGEATRVRERVRLWNAVAGSAQILTGGRVTIPGYRDAAHPRGVLRPGPDGRYDAGRSWHDLITSRTVAGLSRNRRVLTLAVVQGRAGVEGLTLAELAALLRRDFGVWDALNLDGGGSTAMAWRDPATGRPALLNVPTDGADGRRVASSLAVFAPSAH